MFCEEFSQLVVSFCTKLIQMLVKFQKTDLPSLIFLQILLVLQISPCTQPTMMHRGIGLHLPRLPLSYQNLSILLHHFWILAFRCQHDMGNCYLFGILFG